MPLQIYPNQFGGLAYPPTMQRAVFGDGADQTHTGTTSETTLVSYTLPGGTMGPNGCLEIPCFLATNNNSAGTKTNRIYFGGTLILEVATTTATMQSNYRFGMNRNSNSSQIWFSAIGNANGVGGTTPFTTAINTGADVVIAYTAQLSNGADSIIFRHLPIVVYR